MSVREDNQYTVFPYLHKCLPECGMQWTVTESNKEEHEAMFQAHRAMHRRRASKEKAEETHNASAI